jgi:hypothetical protein
MKSSGKPEQGTAMQLKWADSNMKSSYANVRNAMSTRVGDFFDLDGNAAFDRTDHFRTLVRSLLGSPGFRRRGFGN